MQQLFLEQRLERRTQQKGSSDHLGRVQIDRFVVLSQSILELK